VTHTLRTGLIACFFAFVVPLAVAQTGDVERLLPASIGEFTVDEHYTDEQMPLFGNTFFSGLPAFRMGAAYTSETGGEVHVSVIMVNERYPGVIGLNDEQAALGLVSFRDAPLAPHEGWHEASVEENMDEMIIGRAIVARPLTGHAVLMAETYTPESVSTAKLRNLLAQLDLDALTDHARTHGDVNSAVWDLLTAMPLSLAGQAIAGFHIESDGMRMPVVSVNALYGDADEPEFAVVASGAGPEVTDITEILPFRPSADLTETTFGDWRALDGVIDGVGGHIVMGDLAVVGLFHLSPTSTMEHRRDILSGVDIQGIFDSAANFRTTARAAAPPPSDSANSEMRLVSWAHVVDGDLIRSIIEIDDEQIVFPAGHPQLADFSLMDILLSHNEEHPFLRRIVSIESRGEAVIIETRPASLEEAIAPR
jgi:hypothetical protein